MEIKFNIKDEVYLYDTRNIVKTKVKSVNVKENEVRYVLEGYYHSLGEKDLFACVDDLLEHLKQNIVSPLSMTEKAKQIFKR